MFQVLFGGLALPASFPVDESAEFLPGQIAQVKLNGNNIVVGVSDGTAPFGIIDDVKTRAFTANSVDEVVLTPIIPFTTDQAGRRVSVSSTKIELAYPSIVAGSFISDPVDVALNQRNGVVEFLAGTELNFDADGDGLPDSIRTVVSYSYAIPNVPGEDSTAASHQVTVWFAPLIGSTDQFDLTCRWAVNAPCYVNAQGKLTSRQPSPNHPAVAMVLAPPNSMTGSLQFFWR